MERSVSLRVSAAILIALLASACQMSTNEPSTREEFIAARGLADYKSVEFQDEHGSPITYEQFSALAKDSRSFAMIKNPGASKAIVRVEANENGSAETIAEEPKLAILPGALAPRIETEDLDGSPVTYSEKPTLVSFFFAECAPCIKEIPQINALARDVPEIQLISLTFDETSVAESFVSRYQLETRVVAEEQDFIDAMGVKTYPVYALIGTDGRLLGTQSGATLQLPHGETVFKRWIRAKLGT